MSGYCYHPGNLVLPKQPGYHLVNRVITQATVVPAKAGIQEIPRKRAGRLPRVLDSGFRRNDGFIIDGFMV